MNNKQNHLSMPLQPGIVFATNQPRVSVELKLLVDNAQLPAYQTAGAGAVDLCAIINEPVILHPGDHIMIGTGIAINIKNVQIAALVLSRSGIAARRGLVLRNGVGLIDSDYQGEIKCCIVNTSKEDQTIAPNERIAQLMFIPVYNVAFDLVSSFAETSRGTKGFGSTGT